MSLDFFLLKYTCILCKKHGTKWKKMIVCIRFFFHNDWHFFAIKMKEVLYKLLTVLIKCVIIFYHLVCCFLNTSQKVDPFLSCCWLDAWNSCWHIQENSLVTAVCQISIRNQSAVCYAFSGSRRHFDVILRSLILPSARSNGFL